MNLMDVIRRAVGSDSFSHPVQEAVEDKHATISAAQSEAEIKAAFDEAFEIGRAKATARWGSVIKHPNIMGNAARLAAATDLLTLAPEMAAEDVVHAVEAMLPHDMRAEYEASRLAALEAVGWPGTVVN